MPSSRARRTPARSRCPTATVAPVAPVGNACPAKTAATVSSTRRWKNCLLLAATLALNGCLRDTPDRARIVATRVLSTVDGAALDVTQELRFSDTMRTALQNGIALRLVYRVSGCGVDQVAVLRMRYAPLGRHFELQHEGREPVRRFARIGALFAALDRIRLPLRRVPDAGCRGDIHFALDLTSLPTPLRFPAFLDAGEWRMVSPPTAWPTASPRA